MSQKCWGPPSFASDSNTFRRAVSASAAFLCAGEGSQTAFHWADATLHSALQGLSSPCSLSGQRLTSYPTIALAEKRTQSLTIPGLGLYPKLEGFQSSKRAPRESTLHAIVITEGLHNIHTTGGICEHSGCTKITEMCTGQSWKAVKAITTICRQGSNRASVSRQPLTFFADETEKQIFTQSI